MMSKIEKGCSVMFIDARGDSDFVGFVGNIYTAVRQILPGDEVNDFDIPLALLPSAIECAWIIEGEGLFLPVPLAGGKAYLCDGKTMIYESQIKRAYGQDNFCVTGGGNVH